MSVTIGARPEGGIYSPEKHLTASQCADLLGEVGHLDKLMSTLNHFQKIDEHFPDIIKTAGDVGNRAHDEIFSYISKGEFDSDNCIERAQSIVSFFATHGENINIVAAEIPYYCPDYKLGGTIDAVYEKDGRFYILEWKTGSYRRNQQVQVALYKYLLQHGECIGHDFGNHTATGAALVMLKADGFKVKGMDQDKVECLEGSAITWLDATRELNKAISMRMKSKMPHLLATVEESLM